MKSTKIMGKFKAYPKTHYAVSAGKEYEILPDGTFYDDLGNLRHERYFKWEGETNHE